MSNYYDILGVQKNASKDDIIKAYRKIAMECHPDRMQGKTPEEVAAAEEKFKNATEAKEVLTDDDKRKEYDTFGTVGNNRGMPSDDMDAFFQRMAQAHGFGRQRPTKGQSIKIRVGVTLEDIHNEAERTFPYDRYTTCSHCHGTRTADGKQPTPCPHCHGTGVFTQTQQYGNSILQQQTVCPYCQGQGVVITNPCPHCNGTGQEAITENCTIKITANDVINGQIILHGKGYSSQHGGPNGDLIILLYVKQHDRFNVDSNGNLMVQMQVPIIDCLLGCERNIQTIDGTTLKFDIKECTKDGDVLRLHGKGLKWLYGRRGDLLIDIAYIYPQSLSKEDKETLNKLKESQNFKD